MLLLSFAPHFGWGNWKVESLTLLTCLVNGRDRFLMQVIGTSIPTMSYLFLLLSVGQISDPRPFSHLKPMKQRFLKSFPIYSLTSCWLVAEPISENNQEDGTYVFRTLGILILLYLILLNCGCFILEMVNLPELTQLGALMCQDIVCSRTFPWGLRKPPSNPWEGLPFWAFLWRLLLRTQGDQLCAQK